MIFSEQTKYLDERKKQVLSLIEKQRDEIISFLRELIKIPSVVGKEGEAQRLVAERLSKMNLELDMWEPKITESNEQLFNLNQRPWLKKSEFKNRPLVVGKLRGSGKGRSLLLNGHIDVVPVSRQDAWTHNPWGAEIENGIVYGRGAVDMKGGLVSMIMALDSILRAGVKLSGDVILESVIDEERSGVGTLECIARGYKADAGVVLEPSDFNIVTAHCGVVAFRIKVKGKAVHRTRKSYGVSAIDNLFEIYQSLNQLERYREFTSHHSLISHSTYPNVVPISVGTIRAGDWYNTIPEEGEMEFSVGFMPGERIEEIEKKIRQCIEKVAAVNPWLRSNMPEIEMIASCEPLEVDTIHPIVETVRKAHEQVRGKKTRIIGTPSGSDTGYLAKYACTPSILFGPGSNATAHAADECLAIDELIAATKVVALTILDWCK